MIIRLSNQNDINGIVNLWNEAFGDSENEIRFFLDNKFVPENTLIVEKNGLIASMLFLLDGNMRINNRKYSSYYLYAACTAKKFRGKGYMSFLLEKANEVAFSRGKDYICLMPGEKSLFDFYEKHGYITVFNKKVLTVNRNECNFNPITEDTVAVDFEDLRNRAFLPFDYFEWDNSSIRFASAHTEMYSGRVLLSSKGYCLYSETDHVLTVKEFAFTEENFCYGLNLLLSSCDCEKVIFNLPSEYKTEIGKYEIFPSAMIYPLSTASKTVADSLKNAYLGLTLD